MYNFLVSVIFTVTNTDSVIFDIYKLYKQETERHTFLPFSLIGQASKI